MFALAYPGELINLTVLNPAQPTSSSGSAVTDCEVYRIDLNRLESAGQEDPGILKMLNQFLQKQVALRTKALVEVKSLSPATRLEQRLGELAEVLGCNILGQPVRVPVPLRDGEMATLLGLSDRQFKRVKKSLQQNGSIGCGNSRMFALIFHADRKSSLCFLLFAVMTGHRAMQNMPSVRNASDRLTILQSRMGRIHSLRGRKSTPPADEFILRFARLSREDVAVA